MRTYLFVHGTGVREDSYARTCAEIEAQLEQHDGDSRLVQCYWGDKGASLPAEPHSIPAYESTKALGGVTREDQTLALWEMLYDDPLFELRLVAQAAAAPGGAKGATFALGQQTPAQALQAAVDKLRNDAQLEASARAKGLTRWSDACTYVTGSLPYKDARASPAAGSPPHRVAIARALVAALIRRVLDDGMPVPTGDERDAMVEEIMQVLGGRDKAALDIVTKPLIGIAERIATWKIKRNRGTYTDKSFEAIGDILLYQARGDAIRAEIRSRAVAAGPAVVLVAHSLGGIACVDLLASNDPPQVRALVTAGSQSPFFYEIGALWSREYGKGTPEGFPPWLNFYDRNDALSYMAQDVFPTATVRDIPVASGQPFPASHSAYWRNPVLWKEIVKFLDALQP